MDRRQERLTVEMQSPLLTPPSYAVTARSSVWKRLIRYLLIMLPVLGLGLIVNPAPAAAGYALSCSTTRGSVAYTTIHGVGAWWITPGNWFYNNQDYCQIGKSRLMVTVSGNLILEDENFNIRWSSHTTCVSYACNATFQADGNFVLYQGIYTSSPVKWASNTCCHSGWNLMIQADGNMVIYDANQVARWATNTNH